MHDKTQINKITVEATPKCLTVLSFPLFLKPTIFVPDQFIAMNLLQYFPDNNQTWIQPYADSIGWDKLVAYYDKIWLMLYNMQRGHIFRVLEEVSPNNYDLFMKCVYTILCEFDTYGIYSYYIEEQGTVILRR